MSDDYGYPSQRKSKKQMRLKRKYRVYKKGGQFRGQNITYSGAK
jgi:hypothetical protein